MLFSPLFSLFVSPVCLDNAIRIPQDNCLVYSFGVFDDWTFEEMMEKYGCNVFAFDSSNNLNDHNRTANIRK